MSDANVRFLDIGYDESAPGLEVRFEFRCPRSKTHARCSGLIIAGRTDIPRDPQNQNGGCAQWDWDKNRDRPTFKPSINCGSCWHGFIENGRCVDVDHKDEPEC